MVEDVDGVASSPDDVEWGTSTAPLAVPMHWVPRTTSSSRVPTGCDDGDGHHEERCPGATWTDGSGGQLPRALGPLLGDLAGRTS